MTLSCPTSSISFASPQPKSPTLSLGDITLILTPPLALEDLQVYKLVYELAIEEGIGKRVNIASRPKYSKNIYDSYFL
jgi:hypothetical protein